MGRLIKYIGSLLAVALVAFLLWRGASEMKTIDLASGQAWLSFFAGLFLYSASQIIGAWAWRATLMIYDVHLPRGQAESQLLVSQIGKYIPGNFAHFLGRAALAKADGIGALTITGAMLLEIGFLFTAGAAIVAMLFLVLPDFLHAIMASLPQDQMQGPVLALAVGLLVCVLLGQLFLWRRAGQPRIIPTRLIAPILLHLVNFAILGVSLWCVTLAVDPTADIWIGQCMVIFTIAWVAGFVMPGAPGGVGIRDGVITFGLELFVGVGVGLGAALLHRVVSVLGDICIFVLGVLMRKRQKMAT